MHLHWSGHSCFQLTFANGTRITTDPFDESVGYPLPSAEADVVTCSHDHFDHGFAQAVAGHPTVIRTAGAHEVGGVAIDGMASFHDDAQGAKRGCTRALPPAPTNGLAHARLQFCRNGDRLVRPLPIAHPVLVHSSPSPFSI